MSESKRSLSDSPWVGIGLSLILPIFVMKKLSGPTALGPLMGMLVALCFPLINAGLEYRDKKRFGLVPMLGIANVLLTGSIVVLSAGRVWFAVKEAVIPALIGVAVLVSQRTEKPLIKSLFLNDQIMNLKLVNESVSKVGAQADFDKEMARAGILIGISFFVSAVLNFGFAWFIVTEAPGTEAFNQQVGTMQWTSFVAIMVCCTSLMMYALYRVGNLVVKRTGLKWDDILNQK
jgi:hypothetical protein